MLWCHNSLSGSLAWQPFVMRRSPPKVGWEKRGSSPVVPFILLLFHHVCYTHTHTRACQFTCLPNISLPTVPEAARKVKGIRLIWQPLPAHSGLPGPRWEVKSLNDTLKWEQGDERCGVKDHLMCTWYDIWERDGSSDADISPDVSFIYSPSV